MPPYVTLILWIVLVLLCIILVAVHYQGKERDLYKQQTKFWRDKWLALMNEANELTPNDAVTIIQMADKVKAGPYGEKSYKLLQLGGQVVATAQLYKTPAS